MSHLSVWCRPLRHCSTEGLLCDSHSFIILQNAKNGAGSHSQSGPTLCPVHCLSELVTTNHIVTSCGCLGTRRGLGLLGPQHLLEHREAWSTWVSQGQHWAWDLADTPFNVYGLKKRTKKERKEVRQERDWGDGMCVASGAHGPALALAVRHRNTVTPTGSRALCVWSPLQPQPPHRGPNMAVKSAGTCSSLSQTLRQRDEISHHYLEAFP